MFFKDADSIKEVLESDEIIEFEGKTLVLASNSSTRFRIMENMGLKFVVIPSLANEEELKKSFNKIDTKEKACEYVKLLALAKAKWVNEHTRNAVTIAADTVVFCEKEILEKPKDEADARRIFSLISNSVHDVITGVCIIDDQNIDNFAKASPIKMLEISKDLQDVLVKDKLTYTYAGGYCIDGNLEGKAIVNPKDFNNILGLPIEDIIIKLKEAGYDFSK